MENDRKLLVETLERRMPFAADFATSVDVIAHNSILPADVDGSGAVEVTDALILINTLNGQSTGGTSGEKHFPDVDGDGNIGPTDVLRVVNLLNYQTQTSNLVSAPAHGHTTVNESEETPANAQLPPVDPTMIVFVSGLIPKTAVGQIGTTAESNAETEGNAARKTLESRIFRPVPRLWAGLTRMIQVGLSLMIEEDFRAATEQLFLDGLVDIAEWSFDMGWGRTLPAWLERLLIHYSESGNLLGHGVSYSILDASHSSRTQQWLVNLKAEKTRLSYRHVTAHFGFMGAGHFHFSAPLPMPLTNESEAIGRQRLVELAKVVDGPVGLENLAFAFSLKDVADQGHFLDRLLESVDGFLLLDLHNIYCQTCNFEISGDTLLSSYPLNRVRELHVSGGSWSRSDMDDPDRLIRRDTHDDQVPEAVFELLELALKRCPLVETVVLERLGGTYWRRGRGTIAKGLLSSSRHCGGMRMSTERKTLAEYQAKLLEVLARSDDVAQVQEAFANDSAFQPFREYTSQFDAAMIQVAMELTKKWGRVARHT